MNTPMQRDEYLIERLNSDLATHGLRVDEAEQVHHVQAERTSAVVPMADMAPPAEENESTHSFHPHSSAHDEIALRDRHTERPAHEHVGHGHAEDADVSTQVDPARPDTPHLGNGSLTTTEAVAATPTLLTPRAVTVPEADNPSAAADARGVLDGVAHSLRTLAGRDAMDGVSVAIFPRGVDLLEVRMHISGPGH